MKNYGILAHPAGHSLSPVMHNAAFRELGIDAQYRAFDIPENEFADFMQRVASEPISGLSVSLPYKEVIIDQLHEVSEDARTIGAVNTVLNKGGHLYGYNTDHLGALAALGGVSGLKVVVLGAGGAARAIVYGLVQAGAEVFVVARNEEKAAALASEFGCSVGDFSMSADVLIQATSIWTVKPDAVLEDLCGAEFVEGFDKVMDIVYKPLMTPLLVAAEAAGKEIITGEKMLLYQAVEQFKIWTDQEAPVEVMREALTNALGK
ncbi:shikimate dehydrogenase [Candidatus Gracilibacteria bacterium]|nr:shikimate dehydrogenase [Candidatus Gracilibacteria bacterium]